MNTTSFIDSLAVIYPESRLLQDSVQLMPYESDALTAFRARPRAVVLPESADEVVETVLQDGDIFVTLGAGSIGAWSADFLAQHRVGEDAK